MASRCLLNHKEKAGNPVLHREKIATLKVVQKISAIGKACFHQFNSVTAAQCVSQN